MNVTIHNPERKDCHTMYVPYTTKEAGYVGVVEFECESGGTATMIFESPEDLEAHATAMKLLAETLREKQCATSD